MNKRELLKATTFGERVAEDEVKELSSYFVETEQWSDIFSGAKDIILGPKGSGKSAIYALLNSRSNTLFDRGILLLQAENVRGNPVFQDLTREANVTEDELEGLWKVYFLCLLANNLKEFGIGGEGRDAVLNPLIEAELLPSEWSLARALRSAFDYVRDLLRFESLEAGIELDAASGLPTGVTGKVSLREPDQKRRKAGTVSANELLGKTNQCYAASGLRAWITIDRLDVAFAGSEDLETKALRALFRVYRDFEQYEHISLKIFLRSDIKERVFGPGFREASHLTREVAVTWDQRSLLNLLVRRMLKNEPLCEAYGVDRVATLKDATKQSEFFYRVFPSQVDVGPNKPHTFDWMLSRVSDGHRLAMPRELIHLLVASRAEQLRRYDLGVQEPTGEALFERVTMKEALPEVSRVRLNQTLYAEYPEVQPWVSVLKEQRSRQTVKSLSALWNVAADEASTRAKRLVAVGFFEEQVLAGEATFWVPFLYRGALEMVQGTAD